MNTTARRREISVGDPVGLRRTHRNSESRKLLKGWIKAYGRGPFRVRAKCDDEHVTLEAKGQIIHFGGSDPSLHIGFVCRWRR